MADVIGGEKLKTRISHEGRRSLNTFVSWCFTANSQRSIIYPTANYNAMSFAWYFKYRARTLLASNVLRFVRAREVLR